MAKAKDILEKLKQRREDAEAIKAYWEGVLPEIGSLPESQLQGWMQRFALGTIIAGLDAAVIKRSKLDAKGEKLNVQEAVDYASAAMREAHFEAMPEEERRKFTEKMVAISRKRSEAAKKGNQKRWHSNDDQREVATISDGLRQDAMPLRTGSGSGSGFGSGSAAAFASERATASASATAGGFAATKTATIPLEKTETEIQTQTPKPKTNPAGASGLSANQQPKAKTIKTAKGEQPKPYSFDSWTNVQRTEWIACTCNPDPCFEDGDFVHKDGCAVKALDKAVAAPEKLLVEPL
jgi:hypothetical protein